MPVLNFKVCGDKLRATGLKGITAYTRNNAYAKFDFNEEWAGVSPVVAQFWRNCECCYDCFIENSMCAIPWEVLEKGGKLNITVMGGDLLITNSVEIRVYESGLVGGLVPTTASPSVYSYIVEKAEKMEADYSSIDEFVENIDKYTEECTGQVESAVENAKNEAVRAAIEEIEEKAEELITFEPITEEEIDDLFN